MDKVGNDDLSIGTVRKNTLNCLGCVFTQALRRGPLYDMTNPEKKLVL